MEFRHMDPNDIQAKCSASFGDLNPLVVNIKRYGASKILYAEEAEDGLDVSSQAPTVPALPNTRPRAATPIKFKPRVGAISSRCNRPHVPMLWVKGITMDANTLAYLALTYFATQHQNQPEPEWFKDRNDNDTAEELCRAFKYNNLGLSLDTTTRYARRALDTCSLKELSLTESIIIPTVTLALGQFVTRLAQSYPARHTVEIIHTKPRARSDIYRFNTLEDAEYCARMLFFLEQTTALIDGEPFQ